MRMLCYDSPFFERFQTRFRRRSIVVAYLLVVLGVLVATRVMDTIDLEAAATATIAGIAIVAALGLNTLAVAGILLAGSTRGVAEHAQGLDERQKLVHAFSYRDAFWPAVIVGAWAGNTVADLLGDERWLYAVGTLTAAAALIYGLPALILAWRLPDERADEA
mgnify:CR=1 FL=1